MTEEVLRKLSKAESAEQLLELAKAEGMDLTEEQASAYFEKYHPPVGELSDEEIANVTGGGCGGTPQPPRKFHVGERVLRRGDVACAGAPGWPCRNPYMTVNSELSYYEQYESYRVEIGCPVCHVSIQVFERDLRPV